MSLQENELLVFGWSLFDSIALFVTIAYPQARNAIITRGRVIGTVRVVIALANRHERRGNMRRKIIIGLILLMFVIPAVALCGTVQLPLGADTQSRLIVFEGFYRPS